MKPNYLRMFLARMRRLGPLERLFGRADVPAQDVLRQDETLSHTHVDPRTGRKNKISGFISLGILSVFSGGVISGFVPMAVLKITDNDRFCLSCHTMTHLEEETKRSRHYQNKVGVKVGCPDCHVPREVGEYLRVKVAALKDVFIEMTNPALTKEDYEQRRPRLAQKVREDYLKNDSANCKTCHAIESFTVIIKAHKRAVKTGMTCIQCHYNLVHGEVAWPEMEEDEYSKGRQDNRAEGTHETK